MLLSAKPTITFQLVPSLTSVAGASAGLSVLRAPSTRSKWPVPPTPSPQIAVSDSEIAGDLLVVEHMRLVGRFAHLLDGDRIEVGEKGFARPAHSRVDHPLEQN